MTDGQSNEELALALESDDRSYWTDVAHGPAFVRMRVDEDPVVVELVQRRGRAAAVLLSKFANSTASTDMALAASAYVLEKVRSRRAVPVLMEYLRANIVSVPGAWAPHLVTHALKVITRQPDRDEMYYSYDDRKRRGTIRRARARFR